jgi:hypothetical protein
MAVASRPDVSRRATTATFVFGEEPAGEIVMEGACLSPGKDSMFVTDRQLVRSITGGSKIYSVASLPVHQAREVKRLSEKPSADSLFVYEKNMVAFIATPTVRRLAWAGLGAFWLP